MQSQETNRSQNSPAGPSSAPKGDGLINAPKLPTADAINQTFADGQSPLEFITKNLKARMESQPVPGESASIPPTSPVPAGSSAPVDPLASVNSAPPQPQPAGPRPKTVDDLFSRGEKPPEKPVEFPQAPDPFNPTSQENPPTTEQEGDADDEFTFVGPDGKKQFDFKKLRTREKEVRKTLKEKETALTELSTKIQKYETGEEVPPAFQSLSDRVQQLERYEKMVSLKTSPEYIEKARPLNEAKQKLDGIVKDYEVNPEIINRALGTKNRAERNRLLASNFDPVGALEVKQLMDQMESVSGELVAMEQEPGTALSRLQEESAAVQRQNDERRVTSFQTSSRTAWVKSLDQIRKDNKIHELIVKDGDEHHNKTYAEPTLQKASLEYGKLVRELFANGLKELPDQLGEALAKSVLYSHALSIAAPTRYAAEQYAAEVEANARRTNSHVRPQVGATYPGGASQGGRKPRSTEEAAESLISNTMRR